MNTNIVHVSLHHMPSKFKKNDLFKKMFEKYKNKENTNEKIVPLSKEFYENEISTLILIDMFESVDFLYEYLSDISFMNFDFIIDNEELIIKKLPELKKKIPNSSFLKQIIILLEYENDILIKCITKENYLSLLKYCIETNRIVINLETICSDVSKYGHFEMLRYVHNLGGEMNDIALSFAIQNNDDKCYNYILEHIEREKSNEKYTS